MNNAKSPIYNSECLSNTCKFDKVKIPASLLGNGIILDFFNSKNKLVAEIPTNVEELIKKNFYVKPHKSRTYAITSNSFLTRNYIFIDYLKAGVQIGLSIAIDFTGSNGAPNQKTSLHYLGGNQTNMKGRYTPVEILWHIMTMINCSLAMDFVLKLIINQHNCLI